MENNPLKKVCTPKRERCWSYRPDGWGQMNNTRCQRMHDHPMPHRHTYHDGVVEWKDGDGEKAVIIKLKEAQNARV